MLILSRPQKLDHIDTIRYEIDMLRFTVKRLAKRKLTDRDAWVYLEAFLLHYRNLIEFLGKDKPSDSDLHVTTIWGLMNVAAPANLNEIFAKGKELLSKYERKGDHPEGRISQYLSHCTTKRTDAKDWEVSVMFNEIEPWLCEVEKYLGRRKFIFPAVSTVGRLDEFSASTTVATITSAAIHFDEASIRKLKDFK